MERVFSVLRGLQQSDQLAAADETVMMEFFLKANAAYVNPFLKS